MGSTLGSKAVRFYGRKMEELREGWFEGSHVAGEGKKEGCDSTQRLQTVIFYATPYVKN